MDSIIRDFLECSMKKDFDEFDFDDAFTQFGYYLNDKLMEHGFCEIDDYIDHFIDNSKNYSNHPVENFAVSTCYIEISEYEVLEAIAKLHYEKCNDAISGIESYEILVRLKEKLDNWDSLPESELINLFDECIHAQHETGSIIDCDIERMKKELDEKYKNKVIEKMFEPVTA